MVKNPNGDLVKVVSRVKQKRQDYISYNFSSLKNDILKTFFDLAQEYDNVDDFYRVCVIVLKETLGVESSLYIINATTECLELVCDSLHGIHSLPLPPPESIQVSEKTYEVDESFCVPVYCKRAVQNGDNKNLEQPVILGLLEVSPIEKLTDSDKFFLTKYSNRIGYNLRKRMLDQQNISHLNFINNLVSDIEHNVIIPNMYFNHLFKQLRKNIDDFAEVESSLLEVKKENKFKPELIENINTMINSGVREFESTYQEIVNHHSNCTLFLESLLRRDHFKEGHLVLRHEIINVDQEIIKPQLEQFSKRLIARNIDIKTPHDLRKENYSIKADLGLLSQVYANFFSNAVKFTETIIDHNGQQRRIVAYGRKILSNHYGPNKPAIKLNVFTTGTHLTNSESKKVFLDGFQGSKSIDSSGYGHGLSFVKYVVELHGGSVGYTPTAQGNNFYFILPLEDALV